LGFIFPKDDDSFQHRPTQISLGSQRDARPAVLRNYTQWTGLRTLRLSGPTDPRPKVIPLYMEGEERTTFGMTNCPAAIAILTGWQASARVRLGSDNERCG
jgi:hypothetical protein